MKSERCDDPGWVARDRLTKFEQILGQPFVASRLGALSRKRNIPSPLMLTGAAGVGKTAVANLFAHAIICETPQQSGSPCMECIPCRLFVDKGHPSVLRLNASGEDFEGAVDRVAALADKSSLLSDRRVTIISNPCEDSERTLDRLLKTLERLSTDEIIFLADAPEKFSPSIRSRSERLRLLPLDRSTSLARLQMICTRESVMFEEAALEAIGLQCRYGAGELFNCLWSIAHTGKLTLHEVREDLHLNWPDLVHTAWMRMLDSSADDSQFWLKDVSSHASEALERLQLYLQWLTTCKTSSLYAFHPAFVFRSADKAERAVRMLSKAGLGERETFASLDRAQAFWANCDATDWVALDEYARRFRAEFL